MFLNSSAEPEKLITYSSSMLRCDHDLSDLSVYLERNLAYFSSQCTDRQFQISIDGISDKMRIYSHQAHIIDRFVGTVGHKFWIADLVSLIVRWDRLDIAQLDDYEHIIYEAAILDSPDHLNIDRLAEYSDDIEHIKTIVEPIADLESSIAILELVILAVNIYSDHKEGAFEGDLSKIIRVNILDLGVDKLLVILNPKVILVLVGNAVFQLGGSRVIARLERLGDVISDDPEMKLLLEQDTERSRDALRRANLKNVIREVAESIDRVVIERWIKDGQAMFQAIGRVLADPSLQALAEAHEALDLAIRENWHWREVIEDLLEGKWRVLKAILVVFDGIKDLRRSVAGTYFNLTVAGSNRLIQEIDFLPQEFRDAVDSLAKEIIGAAQGIIEFRNSQFDVDELPEDLFKSP